MSSRSQTPSKGPPPLPTLDLPDAPFAAPLGDVADVEEAFFLEGIDGHVESLPSEPEAQTIALAPFAAQPLELEREAEQADVEDPARARRRRAARIGVVWGAALMVGVAGASAFMSAHGHERSPVALSTSPAPVERMASLPATTPVAATPPSQVSPAPQPAAAVTPPHSPVRATASAKAVGAAHPRAAVHKKGAALSRGAKPSPASPKASSARATQTRTPSTRVAASKPQRRGPTTAGASVKASG